MKIKPILPTLKEKKRYLSFDIVSQKDISVDAAAKAVSQSTLQFLGTMEAGKAGMLFFKDKYHNNAGVIKTGHLYVDKIRSALMLITAIDNNAVIVRTRVVSGTLKKAISKFNDMKDKDTTR